MKIQKVNHLAMKHQPPLQPLRETRAFRVGGHRHPGRLPRQLHLHLPLPQDEPDLHPEQRHRARHLGRERTPRKQNPQKDDQRPLFLLHLLHELAASRGHRDRRGEEAEEEEHGEDDAQEDKVVEDERAAEEQ